MIYLSLFYPHKKILMHTRFHVKQSFFMIDENEISTLKTKFNTLRNILKKYEFDKAKLEAMFSKKNSSKKHIHTTHADTFKSHTKHAHVSHAHHTHHAYMILYKEKFSMIDENEISTLKTKINTLGNILKKCEFDKAKLEAMFSKKNSSKDIFILHMLTLLNHTLSMVVLIIHICIHV